MSSYIWDTTLGRRRDHDDQDALVETRTTDDRVRAGTGHHDGRDLDQAAALQAYVQARQVAHHAFRRDLEQSLARDRPPLHSAHRRLPTVLLQDSILAVAKELLELRDE